MTSSRGSQENRKIKQNRRVDLHNIVYHMDADGRTAAAILRQYLEDHLSHKVAFHPINYGMPVPDMSSGAWWVLDFSFQPEQEMNRIAEELGDRLVWIDHHDTSIQAEQKYPELKACKGIRSNGKAGCVLTWEYLYQRPIPGIVEMVGEFDIWNRTDEERWETEIRPLVAYLDSIEIDPKYPDAQAFWNRVLNDGKDEHWTEVHAKVLADAIEKGNVLKTCLDAKQDSKMKHCGFTGTFAGHKAVMINDNSGGSLKFERVFYPPDFDLMVGFEFDGSRWHVGLYTVHTDSIHCGNIAHRLGQVEGPYKTGGGHRGAAGFETTWEHLSSLMVRDRDQVTKGGKPVGSTSERKDGTYRKTSEDHWVKVSDDSKESQSDEKKLETLRVKVLSRYHSYDSFMRGDGKISVTGGDFPQTDEQIGKWIRENPDMYFIKVDGLPIFAHSKEYAAPLVDYLRDGGEYGTAEFSRLLGYSEKEIEEYQAFLDLNEKVQQSHG